MWTAMTFCLSKKQPVFAYTSQYIVHRGAIRLAKKLFCLNTHVEVMAKQWNFLSIELQNECIIENPLNKENGSQKWVLVQTSSLLTKYI